jgi:hypothetical protein
MKEMLKKFAKDGKIVLYKVNNKLCAFITDFFDWERDNNWPEPQVPIPSWIRWERYSEKSYLGRVVVDKKELEHALTRTISSQNKEELTPACPPVDLQLSAGSPPLDPQLTSTCPPSEGKATPDEPALNQDSSSPFSQKIAYGNGIGNGNGNGKGSENQNSPTPPLIESFSFKEKGLPSKEEKSLKETSSFPEPIRIWEETFSLSLPQNRWQDITETVGEDLDRWEEACHSWFLHGYKPLNIAGLLDYYQRHEFVDGSVIPKMGKTAAALLSWAEKYEKEEAEAREAELNPISENESFSEELIPNQEAPPEKAPDIPAFLDEERKSLLRDIKILAGKLKIDLKAHLKGGPSLEEMSNDQLHTLKNDLWEKDFHQTYEEAKT